MNLPESLVEKVAHELRRVILESDAISWPEVASAALSVAMPEIVEMCAVVAEELKRPDYVTGFDSARRLIAAQIRSLKQGEAG